MFRTCFCLMLFVCTSMMTAQAGVMIYGTRVIYNQGEREQQVRLTNDGDIPLLVQAWLDTGEEKAIEETSVPFVITPPVFRMAPQKGQTLRIVYTGEDLPQDKESVFWLNILEIPPKAEAESGSGILQLAIRTRIKLFFRPPALKEEPKEIEKKLTWEIVERAADNTLSVRVSNASAYFVSFLDAGLKTGEAYHPLETSMLAPGASAVFNLASPGKITQPVDRIVFNLIDDFGAVRNFEKTLK